MGIEFNVLEEAHLRRLVEDGVPENSQIEFKREVPLETREQKREFLADICAFANTSGGLILIGIEEQDGRAFAANGVATADALGDVLRFQNLVRDGLEPSLPDIRIRHISLESGNCVFAVQIPASWLMPHRIRFGRDGRFLSRRGAQKYEPELPELRAMFLGMSFNAERVRAFREQRIELICRGETPVAIPRQPSVVLHLVPLGFLERPSPIDLGFAHSASGAQLMTPLGGNGGFTIFNLDGVISPYPGPQRLETSDYCQLFRNGSIESLATSLIDCEFTDIPSHTLATHIVRAIGNYLSLLEKVGVTLPIFLMATLVGVKGFRLRVGGRVEMHADPLVRRSFDRQVISVPEQVIDSYQIDVPTFLRPLFDTIWNASGWESCTCYDRDGNFSY